MTQGDMKQRMLTIVSLSADAFVLLRRVFWSILYLFVRGPIAAFFAP